MKISRHVVLGFVFVLLSVYFVRTSAAQNDARDYVVGLWATTTESPASVTLHWKQDPHCSRLSVYRRPLGETGSWGKAIILKPTDSTYRDTTIEVGKAYEYYVLDAAKVGTTTWSAQGYIASGVDISASANGVVILVVDETVAAPLAAELTRLVQDLQAEGYGVIRHDVSRTASVESVKAIIDHDYELNTDHVTTLFLFGHVPVPYSGDIAPDGHVPGSGNHQGAWSADAYYGNFDGDWTDVSVDDTTAYRQANRNVPGDGKFDQNSINAAMNLEVGRVDMANMTAFTKSEVELLRAYLDKDHAFRTGQLTVQKKALVDINFGVFAWYDVPGEDAWRNFPTLVGPDGIVNLRDYSTGGWIANLDTSYLWAYGCGAGSYNSCAGVGVTSDFAQHDAKAVFYMVFGSFFGDWDADNDFTRAPLASGNGLASCWVSRPFWFFHPMAVGKSLGYCTKLTMDNGVESLDYNNGISLGGVHLGLMGDPTLRQDYSPAVAAAPSTFSAQVMGGRVELTWSSVSGAAGYDVYRASSLQSGFEKLNTSLITSNGFTDSAPMADTNYYLLRVAAKISSPSASYYTEGRGSIQSVYVPSAGVSIVPESAQVLDVRQSDGRVRITVRVSSASDVDLSIVDPLGRTVLSLDRGALNPGSKSYTIEDRELASGLYFAKLHTNTGEYSSKIMIAK